jgi:hypothetical protein
MKSYTTERKKPQFNLLFLSFCGSSALETRERSLTQRWQAGVCLQSRGKEENNLLRVTVY